MKQEKTQSTTATYNQVRELIDKIGIYRASITGTGIGRRTSGDLPYDRITVTRTIGHEHFRKVVTAKRFPTLESIEHRLGEIMQEMRLAEEAESIRNAERLKRRNERLELNKKWDEACEPIRSKYVAYGVQSEGTLELKNLTAEQRDQIIKLLS